MSAILEISPPSSGWHTAAELPASKSLSNRWLILEALSGRTIRVEGHSDAEDTVNLQRILQELPVLADAGAGGTTFRFALAYLSAYDGYSGILRGSARLHERPIKPLVEALRSLGADITYLEKEGFPPLSIQGKQLSGGEVQLSAEISSQFLSALLLIAPALNSPLIVHTGNEIASRPYLDMTIELLQNTGTLVKESQGSFHILFKGWKPGNYTVEKDWSSASYWYAMAALAPGSEIFLPGLRLKSLQGDALTANLFSFFGLNSIESDEGVRLDHTGLICDEFGFDFISQPDLAQTMAVVVASLKKKAWFGGLESLRRKETDRIHALRQELAKLDVLTSEPREGELLIDASNASFNREVIIETYDDHRMALAFAPLSILQYRLMIRDPEVIKKSYPRYWAELRKAGFEMREEEN